MSGKLRPEVKAAWVQALRSGEYEQGNGYLHYLGSGSADKFCCLGVLCELAVKDGVTTKKLIGSTRVMTYGDEQAFPPAAVVDWAYAGSDVGDDPWAVAEPGGRRVGLAELNDSGIASFYGIADRIEAGL